MDEILYAIYKNENIVEWTVFITKKHLLGKHVEVDSRRFFLLLFVYVTVACKGRFGFIWKYLKILESCLKHAKLLLEGNATTSKSNYF